MNQCPTTQPRTAGMRYLDSLAGFWDRWEGRERKVKICQNFVDIAKQRTHIGKLGSKRGAFEMVSRKSVSI